MSSISIPWTCFRWCWAALVLSTLYWLHIEYWQYHIRRAPWSFGPLTASTPNIGGLAYFQTPCLALRRCLLRGGSGVLKEGVSWSLSPLLTSDACEGVSIDSILD